MRIILDVTRPQTRKNNIFFYFSLQYEMSQSGNYGCIYVLRWSTEVLCQFKLIKPILWPIKIKIRIFDEIYLFSKYFCGRPHEIYFRHLVRRKQKFIFFWPQHIYIYPQALLFLLPLLVLVQNSQSVPTTERCRPSNDKYSWTRVGDVWYTLLPGWGGTWYQMEEKCRKLDPSGRSGLASIRSSLEKEQVLVTLFLLATQFFTRRASDFRKS